MSDDVFPINIWINEERYQELQEAGLAHLAQDAFAGLKRLQVPTRAQQKDEILKRYPMAKFDSATTRSIELLPREVKNLIFSLVIQTRSLDVIDEFLKS